MAVAGAVLYGIAVVGAGLSAVSAIQSGRVQRAQARSQAQWQRYNAEIQRRQAKRQMREAEVMRQRMRRERTRVGHETTERQLDVFREGERLTGRQRSLLAASGVELSEGSPLLMVAETAAETELMSRRESYQGRLAQQGIYESGMDTARGIEVGAMQSNLSAKYNEGRAQMSLAQGRAAQRASYWQAGSSLLSGVSQIRGMQ